MEINNLRAFMRGENLNSYQKGLALDEFEKLVNKVNELEQLRQSNVVGQSEQLNCPRCRQK